MICSSSLEIIVFNLCLATTFLCTTDLNPSNWIVISGVIATIATIPKPVPSKFSDATPLTDIQAPIANGNIKLDVSGPDATPRKDILGIKVSEKAVLLSIVREDKVKEILATYEDKYFQTKNGKGIAFTIPIKSMIGVMLYQFLAGIEKER